MPVAAIAAAGIGAVGSIYASSQASKANKKAIEAQQQATQQQLALQQQAFAQQQANLAPYLQAGYGALNQLQSKFGLGATPGAANTTNAAGQVVGSQDWNDYLTRYTDVAAQYQMEASTPQGKAALEARGIYSPEQYAQNHYQVFGQRPDENRTVNTVQPTAAPAQGAGGGAGQPQVLPAQYGPEVDERETYTRPEIAARPDFGRAPAAPDLSADAYVAAPNYEIGLLAGQRNLNANFGARGLLGSGAAAQAAIKYGQGAALDDYNRWVGTQLGLYDRSVNQFNQDRAFGNTNYENDRSTANNNFSQDRAFGTGVFESDRTYNTSRFDTNVNDLFRLVSAGNPSGANAAAANYANNAGGILGTNANNLSNLYGQQAQNQAGLISGLTNTMQGLISNYGSFGTPVSPNLAGADGRGVLAAPGPATYEPGLLFQGGYNGGSLW